MKIASLLPSATEIVYALGLQDSLVGVTHECDYPPGARRKPILTTSHIRTEALTSAEIDHAVETRLGGHRTLYALDEERLREFQPDLILTQELCDVCAVSYTEVQRAVRLLHVGARVVSLEPTTLDEVLGVIARLGDFTGRATQATEVLRELRARLDAVRRWIPPNVRRPSAWVSEWLDPPYSAGHWVPDQVEGAGGEEVFHRRGVPSARVTWEQVAAAAPEVIVLAPCGFHLDEVEREMGRVRRGPGWDDLPAVRANEVWAVDASSFFSRPGPRLVAGVELLAQILHPGEFGRPHAEAARRIRGGR